MYFPREPQHTLSLIILFCQVSFFWTANADVAPIRDLQAFQDGRFGIQPTQRFHSAPHIRAPIYQINKFRPQKVDKSPYIFLTGAYSGHGAGPSIISSKDLSLVWADENHSRAQAAQPEVFKGRPVIAGFIGDYLTIYNEQYQHLYQVRAQGDPRRIQLDDHESHLTKDDTVILIYGQNEYLDLTSIGGPKEGAGVRDGRFQEIDPVTNRVIFEFSTLAHFNLNDTIWPYEGSGVYNMGLGVHDFCHMNSVEKTPDGDYLVSYRHLSSIILVDGKTSEVKWVMGGKRNQFIDITVNGTASFAFQHHARLTGKNRFTLFDNAQLGNGFCSESQDKEGHCSRGLEIEFDSEAMTMKMVNEWYHPQGLITSSRGGTQRLPNGGTLVAWGQNALITEYSADGEVVMDIQRSPIDHLDHGYIPVIAYRAFKAEWEGKPLWGPNISSNADEDGQQKLYVSWNGATAVESWVLLLSNSETDLDGSKYLAAESPRKGFETSFEVPGNSSFGRIAALNKGGHIIGSTPVVNINSGQLIPVDYEVTSITRKVVVQPSHNTSSTSTPTERPASILFSDITMDIDSVSLYFSGCLALVFVIILIYVLRRRTKACRHF